METLYLFFGALVMSYIGAHLMGGPKLIRFIGWTVCWQLLTPVRSWYVDIPLFIACVAISEWVYLRTKN